MPLQISRLASGLSSRKRDRLALAKRPRECSLRASQRVYKQLRRWSLGFPSLDAKSTRQGKPGALEEIVDLGFGISDCVGCTCAFPRFSSVSIATRQSKVEN